jgi:ABC-type branched-subunit amino acid transport system substrate-binding protein
MKLILPTNISEGPPLSGERRAQELVIGLCIPLSGSTGLWGPSALAAAKLALKELNLAAGIDGQECRLELINAGDDAPDIEERVKGLINSGVVDVLVGTHISAVRQRIVKAAAGRVPFVFTPLYEGGESTPGVFAIGETPVQQLRPGINWLAKNEHAKRWLLIGNDYIWPRVSHRMARKYIAETGGQVLDEFYLPLGSSDFAEVCDRIRASHADAVLLSLVGQDSIHFTRCFGESGLSGNVKRLSCAIEENELLAVSSRSNENLFVCSSYFGSLQTDANLAFKERYQAQFGHRAPTLNSHGQSIYEGIHFLATLFEERKKDPHGWKRKERLPFSYRSARDARYVDNTEKCAPMYIARATGHVFDVITRL